MALANDTGSSSTDKITDIATLALTGIESGAKVEYSIDGGTTWSTSAPTAAQLAQGANTVDVRQTDVAGNVSATTAFTFTLDTVAPTAPTVALANDTGSSSTDKITDIATLALTGIETGAKVEYSIDGGTTWSTTAPTAAQLAQGPTPSTCGRPTSPATSPTTTAFTFTLDTVNPSAPEWRWPTTPAPLAATTSPTTATLALTGIESGATVEYSIDGGSNWSTSAPTLAQLAQGSNTVDVRQTDVAGNVSATTAFTFTLDTTAPSETISSTIGTNTGLTTTISSGGLTKDNTLTLSGTVSDANGVSSVHVFDGATDLGAATVVSGTWSLTTAALSNGGHSFTAVATDTAGNTTTTAAVTATVDTVAPTGGTPALATGSDSGSSASDNITKVTNPTFQVALNSTVAAGDTVELLLGGLALAHDVTHTVTAADITAGYVSLAVTAGDLGADGAKSITAKFTDAAGNTSTTAADVITLDTTTPTGGTPALAAGSDSGTSGSDNITKVTNPTFQVALNSTVAVGDTVELLLGGSALAA